MKKILFILKFRHNYGNDSKSSLSSGLLNSVTMLVDMINNISSDIEAKYSVVIDNNNIDKEVFDYKPDIVVIEAFWVVPEKFNILKKLHPNVKWIIRNHSKTEFLSNEGIAFNWFIKYLQQELIVACNSIESVNDLKSVANQSNQDENLIIYLPNYYPITIGQNLHYLEKNNILNIGCFGAIRPLKNQMNQAIACIKFSEEIGTKINFHINSSRVEGRGDSILKNLRSLFNNSKNCVLIEHPWLEHKEFLDLLYDMDIVLQVSISETFNIIIADASAMGVPIISSKYIDWLKWPVYRSNIDAESIKNCMLDMWYNFSFLNTLVVLMQQKYLCNYSKKSIGVWKSYLNKFY